MSGSDDGSAEENKRTEGEIRAEMEEKCIEAFAAFDKDGTF